MEVHAAKTEGCGWSLNQSVVNRGCSTLTTCSISSATARECAALTVAWVLNSTGRCALRCVVACTPSQSTVIHARGATGEPCRRSHEVGFLPNPRCSQASAVEQVTACLCSKASSDMTGTILQYTLSMAN